MNTQKVAITVPKKLIIDIDKVSKERGLTRSRYISLVLMEKIAEEKNCLITESYNQIFSDEGVQKEQLKMAEWFDGASNGGGQEW